MASTRPNYAARWFFVLSVFSAIFIVGAIVSSPPPAQRSAAAIQAEVPAPISIPQTVEPPHPVPVAAVTPTPPQPGVTYQVTREWPIGADGIGWNVGFNPGKSGVNQTVLRSLGEALRRDTASFAFAHVMIFSDVRAAKLQPKWGDQKTTRAESALCDRAYVGLYSRNPSQNFEKLDCVLDGMNGTHFFAVDYSGQPLPSPASPPDLAHVAEIKAAGAIHMDVVAYHAAVLELGPLPQTSSWDGSIPQIEDALKGSAHDPDSVSWLDTYQPTVEKHGGVRCWRIPFRFRAKNGFGALTLHTADAYLRGGQVIALKER